VRICTPIAYAWTAVPRTGQPSNGPVPRHLSSPERHKGCDAGERPRWTWSGTRNSARGWTRPGNHQLKEAARQLVHSYVQDCEQAVETTVTGLRQRIFCSSTDPHCRNCDVHNLCRWDAS
jgi:hypothetical protein